MKITNSPQQARAQLTLLVTGALVLAALSFLPNSRNPVSSSEVRFFEISNHGLNIIPASCASLGASYFHTQISRSGDNLGYVLPASASEYGISDSHLGVASCFTNGSGNTYFIPANTASELQSFKNVAGGLGVSAW